MLRKPEAMRARTIWCTTLVLLCHPMVWAQAVTKQLPPPPQQPGQTQPQGTAPDETGSSQPDVLGPDPFSLLGFGANGDPAFAPPPLPSAAAPLPPPEDEPAAEQTLAPEPAITDADPSAAVPLQGPPVGVPVHLEADDQQKHGDLYTLAGHVLIDYKQYIVHADRATYNAATGDVDAFGHVTVDGGPSDEHMVADHGIMNLDRHTAHYYQVTGTLGVRAINHNRYVFTAPNPFAITGDELLQLGPGDYEVVRGTMTSCRLPKPDWTLLAHTIFVDNGEAKARNSLFTLGKLPVFYLPYVSHPVELSQRQSGFLLPVFGNDTQRGFISGEEVYLALGRSADATFGTEYYSRRGFAPLGQLRYKGAGENFGYMSFHALLDRLPAGQNQGGVDIVGDARRQLGPHTRAIADVEYLSSYTYRQAFEEAYTAAINSEVKSQAYVMHERDGLAESARFARYQNFRSDTPGDEIRVLHTPELHLDALDRPVGATPLLWGGEAAAAAMSRSEPGFQTTTAIPRVDLYPHLALPLSAGGWTLRGEAGLRETLYGRSQNPGAVGAVPTQRNASLNRGAFVGEIDLHPPVVERDFDAPWLRRIFGGELRHTLEPEFRYRYVTGINNFRSILRIDQTDVFSDTNELEYGLTQRLFLRHLHPHPCKGDEALGPDTLCGGGTVDWLSWNVAQTYFFDPTFGGAVTQGARNVLQSTLDVTGIAFLTRPRDASPVISRLRLRTTTATDIEWDLDYDTKRGSIQASSVSASYRLKAAFFSVGDYQMHNIGAAASDGTVATAASSPSALSNFNQLRLAAIYGSPVKHGLSTGINLGYDFTLNQMQYTGAQLGYNRDCCGLTFEVRRYSLGSVRDDTQYLFSFTLAGVGAAGNLNRALRVF